MALSSNRRVLEIGDDSSMSAAINLYNTVDNLRPDFSIPRIQFTNSHDTHGTISLNTATASLEPPSKSTTVLGRKTADAVNGGLSASVPHTTAAPIETGMAANSWREIQTMDSSSNTASSSRSSNTVSRENSSGITLSSPSMSPGNSPSNILDSNPDSSSESSLIVSAVPVSTTNGRNTHVDFSSHSFITNTPLPPTITHASPENQPSSLFVSLSSNSNHSAKTVERTSIESSEPISSFPLSSLLTTADSEPLSSLGTTPTKSSLLDSITPWSSSYTATRTNTVSGSPIATVSHVLQSSYSRSVQEAPSTSNFSALPPLQTFLSHAITTTLSHGLSMPVVTHTWVRSQSTKFSTLLHGQMYLTYTQEYVFTGDHTTTVTRLPTITVIPIDAYSTFNTLPAPITADIANYKNFISGALGDDYAVLAGTSEPCSSSPRHFNKYALIGGLTGAFCAVILAVFLYLFLFQRKIFIAKKKKKKEYGFTHEIGCRLGYQDIDKIYKGGVVNLQKDDTANSRRYLLGSGNRDLNMTPVCLMVTPYKSKSPNSKVPPEMSKAVPGVTASLPVISYSQNPFHDRFNSGKQIYPSVPIAQSAPVHSNSSPDISQGQKHVNEFQFSGSSDSDTSSDSGSSDAGSSESGSMAIHLDPHRRIDALDATQLKTGSQSLLKEVL